MPAKRLRMYQVHCQMLGIMTTTMGDDFGLDPQPSDCLNSSVPHIFGRPSGIDGASEPGQVIGPISDPVQTSSSLNSNAMEHRHSQWMSTRSPSRPNSSLFYKDRFKSKLIEPSHHTGHSSDSFPLNSVSCSHLLSPHDPGSLNHLSTRQSLLKASSSIRHDSICEPLPRFTPAANLLHNSDQLQQPCLKEQQMDQPLPGQYLSPRSSHRSSTYSSQSRDAFFQPETPDSNLPPTQYFQQQQQNQLHQTSTPYSTRQYQSQLHSHISSIRPFLTDNYQPENNFTLGRSVGSFRASTAQPSRSGSMVQVTGEVHHPAFHNSTVNQSHIGLQSTQQKSQKGPSSTSSQPSLQAPPCYYYEYQSSNERPAEAGRHNLMNSTSLVAVTSGDSINTCDDSADPRLIDIGNDGLQPSSSLDINIVSIRGIMIQNAASCL
ncbi:unnamed protein product [Protopolystoma xenopodis]|uniref:Uncharacterized protein n=1 Tax=Protopolystoma xenopodis TaxID=117903 RepID=A0A3S5BKU7_9PLAT|nr:unnamed protein product [Protopolystoma xenopodis]